MTEKQKTEAVKSVVMNLEERLWHSIYGSVTNVESERLRMSQRFRGKDEVLRSDNIKESWIIL